MDRATKVIAATGAGRSLVVRRHILATLALVAVGVASCSSEQSPEPDEGPRPGRWSVSGQGATGQQWTADLDLSVAGGSYSGQFTWRRDGQGAGVESVVGGFTSATRLLTLEGRDISGDIQRAKYEAVLDHDSDTLSGIWTGTTDSPGHWTGVFERSHPD
jgi:hypothetical protein